MTSSPQAAVRPLHMGIQTSTSAIETVKEEEKQCRSLAAAKATPILEEFMPIQSKIEEDGGSKVEKDCRDKMNWMSSAQLWSDNNDNSNNNIKNKSVDDVKEKTEESERSAIENPHLRHQGYGCIDAHVESSNT